LARRSGWAAFAKLIAYKERMGWGIDWVSSGALRLAFGNFKGSTSGGPARWPVSGL
jgi:predicted dithiol-disulfide oxidoreductase (DUF899 family)